MLLGKRPRARPPMKRTTSMTDIGFDLNIAAVEASETDPPNPFFSPRQKTAVNYNGTGPLEGLDQRFLESVTSAPKICRRHSGDFNGPPTNFLKACSLCKRRLVPGRDIYMYRGDSAFCSLECRQQQMSQDEKKEKCSTMASKKKAGAGSTKGATVAAVLR